MKWFSIGSNIDYDASDGEDASKGVQEKGIAGNIKDKRGENLEYWQDCLSPIHRLDIGFIKKT